MDKLNSLRIKLEQEFDLPAGQYFEIAQTGGNTVRIYILEEAGGCTVQDWCIDSIEFPYPVPENFIFSSKTDTLRSAAKKAAEYLSQK